MGGQLLPPVFIFCAIKNTLRVMRRKDKAFASPVTHAAR